METAADIAATPAAIVVDASGRESIRLAVDAVANSDSGLAAYSVIVSNPLGEELFHRAPSLLSVSDEADYIELPSFEDGYYSVLVRAVVDELTGEAAVTDELFFQVEGQTIKLMDINEWMALSETQLPVEESP